MAKRTERIEDKLDHVIEKINSIDVTLAGQAVELKDHIKRTRLLEEAQKPIIDHVSRVEGIVNFILYVAIAAAGVEGFKLILDHLHL